MADTYSSITTGQTEFTDLRATPASLASGSASGLKRPDSTIFPAMTQREMVELSRKIDNYLLNYVGGSIVDGWYPITGETWTYTSVSGILGTITVPTDATTKFQVGDFVKLTQSSTVKYFKVIIVAATLLTVVAVPGGELTNSAISSIFLSKTLFAQGLSTFDTWIAPTLLNSWVNFGGGYSTAGYKINRGERSISIKGFIKSGTTAAGTVLFTLPVGYRPPLNILFSTLSASPNPVQLVVQSANGNVEIASAGATNMWLQLDGLNFYLY
jgi:hypothetical protein